MAIVGNSAQSASWDDYDLMKYGVTVSSLPPADFFPTPDPSLDEIDPVILDFPLDITGPPPRISHLAIPRVARRYIGHLDLATRVAERSFILELAITTLQLLDFDDDETFVLRHYTIPLTIRGKTLAAGRTDVCLVDYRSTAILLVLVIDDISTGEPDVEVQVIESAIAAFQYNNKKRRDCGLKPHDIMTIPCITMTNTRPTFYLVPVTTALNNAVITGRHPSTQTRVSRCPTVVTWSDSVGMENMEYRELTLKRFLAFKALAESHWVHILEGFR